MVTAFSFERHDRLDLIRHAPMLGDDAEIKSLVVGDAAGWHG
jgi:hypothetical protein